MRSDADIDTAREQDTDLMTGTNPVTGTDRPDLVEDPDRPDQDHSDHDHSDRAATPDAKPGEYDNPGRHDKMGKLAGTGDYRDRWREVQVRFLDDPRSAAEEAEQLVGDVLDNLTQTLGGQKADLDGWRTAGQSDTEQLRVTVRGYRDLLDRVLTLQR